MVTVTTPESRQAAFPPPPRMALRTYMFLRLGLVAVVVALAVSVLAEIARSDRCVQRSISAYYYTPTRSVFVGALVALGLAMIALWGKDAWEDSCLNLAGMLAPVVAFVPTADANYCSIVTSSGTDLAEKAQQSDAAEEAAQGTTDRLITAGHDAVFNNVVTLLVVIGVTLGLLALVAAIRPAVRESMSEPGYVIGYVVAVLVWLVGFAVFTWNRSWFYEHAHMWSAILLFALVILVVLGNAREKWRRGAAGRPWMRAYAGLGALMVAAALVIWVVGKNTSGWFGAHWVFVLESTLIALFGAFWVLQTFDRRDTGAPRPAPTAGAADAG